MEASAVIATLNDLLARERSNLVTRLVESGVFVSHLFAADLDTLKTLARKTHEHTAWLAERIISLGGTPGLRIVDTATGDLHYLELRAVLPRLIADRESLVRRYEAAVQCLADAPDAVPLVRCIFERHQAELLGLRRIAAPAPAPAAD